MTYQPSDQPRQPDFRTTSSARKGCLIGCGVVVLLMVIAAVALGLFAKHAWDEVTGKNDDKVTVTTNPNARSVSAIEYGQLVSRHGATLSSESDSISKACKSVTSDRQPCRNAVQAMHTELLATQQDLDGVKAPAALVNTDTKLREAVADGLKGTTDVDTGLNNHPLTLAKGLVEVAKAATELREAETQLNSDLGTVNTGA